MRIAVLGENRNELDLVSQVMSSNGHACDSFQDSVELLNQLRRDSYHLLIIDLDAGVPISPEDLQALRDSTGKELPMLLLSGSDGEDALFAALEAGASDYLIKPLRRAELATRVQIILRRVYPDQHTIEQVVFGDYVFEIRSGRLTMNGVPVDMTRKEFDLALLFFRNEGRPLSRAYILESVWSRDTDIPSRTLDTHISRVRNKLQLRPENGFRLVPVYSFGYRLERV